jgi:hypothetical protein
MLSYPSCTYVRYTILDIQCIKNNENFREYKEENSSDGKFSTRLGKGFIISWNYREIYPHFPQITGNLTSRDIVFGIVWNTENTLIQFIVIAHDTVIPT